MTWHERLGPPSEQDKLDRAFADNRAALLRYLRSRVGGAEEARDIAQETYLRLMRVADADMIERPDAYVFKVAANLAGEFLLKRGASLETVDLDALVDTGADGDGSAAARHMEHRMCLSKIDEMLDDMAPLYKSILLLRKRDGFSQAEIAERLGISIHTVKIYLKRALARLRAEWTE